LILRRNTRKIWVGPVPVGGGSPISVQSMTKTDTRDVASTVRQIKELEEAGCHIVRLAVPDLEAAQALARIKAQVNLPLIADIHFDYRLALKALEAGVDGLRLNPGNIGSPDKVRAVVREALARKVPIRIGVNAGSLERDLLQKYGGVTPEAMVESALRHVRILEDMGFYDIKISLKASQVPLMLQAYRLMAAKVSYPLHLGVTEAGPLLLGTVKSSLGIGILLEEGIGDTIRVSLSGDPVMEVLVGRSILRSLGLLEEGVDLVSCPTCARTQIDVVGIANRVWQELKDIKKPLKVAIMGCSVNGPGEAKQAHVGLVGGPGYALLFKLGKLSRKIEGEDPAQALIDEVRALAEEG